MSKTFGLLRALVFIVIQTMVLAFVQIAYGDMVTSLFVSAGSFFLSVLGAVVLMRIFRKRKPK